MLFIPVGIPGCGKSTMADSLSLYIVSSDIIRASLSDVNDQSRNGEVFNIFHETLDAHLKADMHVMADATNLDRGSRAELRRIAERNNVRTHLILFRNVEQAIQRNSERERVVPADVMLRMIDKYERAIQDIDQEHYDFVTEVTAVR